MQAIYRPKVVSNVIKLNGDAIGYLPIMTVRIYSKNTKQYQKTPQKTHLQKIELNIPKNVHKGDTNNNLIKVPVKR